jgi:hypothetical protein
VERPLVDPLPAIDKIVKDTDSRKLQKRLQSRHVRGRAAMGRRVQRPTKGRSTDLLKELTEAAGRQRDHPGAWASPGSLSCPLVDPSPSMS